jgi:DNA (cytosine-5)-methyltransferase 1
MNKPPYRVPTMQEIAAIPHNGYSAISTFSGCGGSSLGYKMAGFKVLWANEFIPAAQDTYRANHPDTILDTRDIRKVTAQDILDAIGMQPGKLDVFDGSPPCASFSTAGKREAGWGKVKAYSDTKQRTDDLFFEYVRLIEGVQPRVFVAENVSGLVKGTAKGYFLEILAALKGAGYRVTAKLLDAQWLGVPQMRQRIIFIGVRNDLHAQPAHPKPLPYQYSVRDALPWIVTWKEDRGYDGHRMMSSDTPMGTVTQSGIGNEVEDKDGRRKFSIAELKRICAFPDDFILTGTYAQQWERLGRAVPPVMMMHIAATIRDEVLAKL